MTPSRLKYLAATAAVGELTPDAILGGPEVSTTRFKYAWSNSDELFVILVELANRYHIEAHMWSIRGLAQSSGDCGSRTGQTLVKWLRDLAMEDQK